MSKAGAIKTNVVADPMDIDTDGKLTDAECTVILREMKGVELSELVRQPLVAEGGGPLMGPAIRTELFRRIRLASG